jgi:DNA polymerase III delta prime subunit
MSKVKKEIKSRCEPIDFNFCEEKIKKEMLPKIYKRLIGILGNEKVTFEKETIEKLIEKCYPDIRCMIKMLQQCSSVTGIINNDIFNIQDVDIELCNLILSRKITPARQFILDSGYDYDRLYSVLFNKLTPKIEDKMKCAKAIIIIEDYQRVSPISLDKELTFVACMFRLLEENVI